MRAHDKRLVAASLLIAASCLTPAAALAGRYHVRVGGELTQGPSLPDDWDLANCYGDLAAALAACAPADSVLLWPETHALATSAVLPALLTNRDLAVEPAGTEVVLGVLGALSANGAAAAPELRGLAIRGGETGRATAAVTVNAAGGLTGITLTGCTFSELSRATTPGTGGAALSAPGVAGGLTIALDRCVFTANASAGRGGAVHVGAGYAVTVDGCTFTGNAALTGGAGGAVAVNATAGATTLVAEDCVFTDNTSAGPGGAIDAAGASVTLRRCDVLGSRSATAAGAFFAEGAGVRVQHVSGHVAPVVVVVEDCAFTDNRGNLANGASVGDGGGLFVKGGVDRLVEVLVSGSVFSGNVNAQGGGLYVGRYAVGLVEYCRFLNNTAWYQGGGAMKGGTEENLGELVTFVYCEFVGNRAGYDGEGNDTGEYSRGGGVMVRNYPRADLHNCTFVDNTVNGFGYVVGDGFAHALEGGEWVPENQCSLVNCAFWGQGNDVQANSEGVGGMAVVSHVAAQAGQLVLGSEPEAPVWLLDFPFVSPDDLNPAEGSPLIDAGADLGYTRDLPGDAVPSGDAPDIGAYEYQSLIAVDDAPVAGLMNLTVYPNPFNPRTTLSARLDTPSSVVVAVFDSRGRLVRELLRGELSAGTHDVAWDGRDDRGRAVATGTYLARLEATGRAPVVTKLVLVR